MVKRLLIANGVIWLLQLLIPGITAVGALSSYAVLQGYLWQPFTYMWLHDPYGPWHILFNMFALWMFGGQLEQVWGSRRFLRFYLTCGVGAGLLIFVTNLFVAPGVATLGASGAIYGVLTAFSLLWPDRTIMLLFPPIPIKAIWFIPLLFVMQLASGPSNVSHVGHLGGVLVAGFILRKELTRYISGRGLRHRWNRYRMRHRLRAVRREEWERRRRPDDDQPPPLH
jgi:membrane associated rhomboid family serine protease